MVLMVCFYSNIYGEPTHHRESKVLKSDV